MTVVTGTGTQARRPHVPLGVPLGPPTDTPRVTVPVPTTTGRVTVIRHGGRPPQTPVGETSETLAGSETPLGLGTGTPSPSPP